MKSIEIYRCKLVKEREVGYMGNISNNEDVARLAISMGFGEYSEEYLGMYCLNTKGDVIAYHEVSHGDLSSSVVHPREVFKRALLCNANSIILIHNHPSGDTRPSLDDLFTTGRLQQCGIDLGVPVLDHIIIGYGGAYYSMLKEGDIEASPA